MQTFKIIPILGLKTSVSQDDPTLFQQVGENVALTHDTGGLNVDYERKRNSVTKAFGYTAWSNSAISSPARCHGLFELDDDSNRDNLIFEAGRVFYYDATPDPVQLNTAFLDYSTLASGPVANGETVTGGTTSTTAVVVTGVSAASGTLYIKDIAAGTGDFSASETLSFTGGATADCDSVVQNTTFNNSDNQNYCAIRYGSYVIFTDYGGQTPQLWYNGEANLTNLITGTAATLYKFRYLTEWYLYVIGLYSNQTNGDIDIRWTSQLPTWSNLTFPSGNQLWKPGNDSIAGVSKLGANALLLYGTESISKFDYYPSATTAFGISPLLQGQGTTSHDSIVNAQGANWFFNKNYGFVRYVGGSRIVASDIISKDIEAEIADIDSRYYGGIVGRYLPRTQQIVWAVPQGAATTPSHLLYYNIATNSWAKEVKAFRAIDTWTRTAGEHQKLVMANADGNVYSSSGEDAAGSAWDGYRIEPVLDFGLPKHRKNLLEIWFGIVDGGNWSIDAYLRTGNTVKELTAKNWTPVGSLSLNDPADPVLRPSNTTYLSYSSLSGTPAAGETVTGDTTSTVATLIEGISAASGNVYIKDITGGTGNFSATESLTFSGAGTADCDSVVLYEDFANVRFVQLKWGTDAKDEKFSVNWIDFGYEVQKGTY